jgi:hypothetical protein
MSAPKKKPRARLRLTHFEVRRHNTLRLRIAIADDAIAEVGDELGALIRKIAPGAAAPNAIVVDQPPSLEIFVAPPHTIDIDDVDAYHADQRSRLAELFGSLCDASLEDALTIARDERTRRTDGGN